MIYVENLLRSRIVRPKGVTWGLVSESDKLNQPSLCTVDEVTTRCVRGERICPRPAGCTQAAAHLQSIAYTPYACGAQRALPHKYS